eukprot:CAMPEP_0170497502 /NCGR_PEP_ID=MMETSP0208-20121228/24887_1 /TAXON_ID=197538 /ORGANISM="Strombidium inclinatum, Strain S3" /LENGTH=47 /DNA_ID= /DNA_START= /DNA_END= /DNA_ORIENTATION=
MDASSTGNVYIGGPNGSVRPSPEKKNEDNNSQAASGGCANLLTGPLM